jgi:hypothetical protein
MAADEDQVSKLIVIVVMEFIVQWIDWSLPSDLDERIQHGPVLVVLHLVIILQLPFDLPPAPTLS